MNVKTVEKVIADLEVKRDACLRQGKALEAELAELARRKRRQG